MDRMLIRHSDPLVGEVTISGAKNSALPILAATLLGTEDIILSDVPRLEDVRVMIEVLEHLGAEVEHLDETTVRINSKNLGNYNTPGELMGKMRASFLVMGPLLARLGKSLTKLPGVARSGHDPSISTSRGFARSAAPSPKTRMSSVRPSATASSRAERSISTFRASVRPRTS